MVLSFRLHNTAGEEVVLSVLNSRDRSKVKEYWENLEERMMVRVEQKWYILQAGQFRNIPDKVSGKVQQNEILVVPNYVQFKHQIYMQFFSLSQNSTFQCGKSSRRVLIYATCEKNREYLVWRLDWCTYPYIQIFLNTSWVFPK